MALKNNRRILRRAEAPLVCSLFSLPPSPFIRHWRRSTPSPQRCTSVVCCVCYKSRKFETSFVSLIRSTNFFVIFVKIFQPATPLKYFYSPQTPLLILGAKPRTPAFSQRRLCHHCEIGALCAGRLSAARYDFKTDGTMWAWRRSRQPDWGIRLRSKCASPTQLYISQSVRQIQTYQTN